MDLDAVPALGNDLFLMSTYHLALPDLACALCVSHAWRGVLDGDDHLWELFCQRAWASKVYVPQSLRRMAASRSRVDDDDEDERKELMRLKISELKDLMRSMRVQGTRAAEFIEKGDFADAVLRARRRSIEEGAHVRKLLGKPSLLVRPGELPAKAALRLSLADAKRCVIAADEISSLTFHVRLRYDGPLVQAAPFDPWWQGKGCGEARFQRDGHLTFTWPTNPEDGEPIDPFAAMGMDVGPLHWALEMGGVNMQGDPSGQTGRVVRILFDDAAASGPQEIVCRHPTNWGWVLYSQGTCWSSWPMPRCLCVDQVHREGFVAPACADPHLCEEALRHLPSEIARDF